MERVFGFLAQHAGIPYLRLLPYQSPLTVLGAFFDRYPTPSPRATRLLTRWLWRGAATEQLLGNGEQIRSALEAVHSGSSDEATARDVLLTVSSQRPGSSWAGAFSLCDARSRLAALALAELRPRDLRTGEWLDVPALLDSGDGVFPRIVTHQPPPLPANGAAVFSSVGNRLLHPDVGDPFLLSMLVEASRSDQMALPSLASAVSSAHVLASHAISEDAMHALRTGDRVAFVEVRRDQIEAATARLVDRHAEWGHPDRLSIAALSDEDD